MGRGKLRIYLGSAPGVGTTHGALAEACRRAADGVAVVVTAVDTHRRERTSELLSRLESVPLHPSGSVDTAAVISRTPRLAVVDDLARPNPPGSPNPTRWQDVEELLEAGIDVLSTVGIHHLESLNDVVHQITGVRPDRTVPDHVVRRAAEVELVDVTPQELRRRMAHGDIHPAERVDAALADYYREGNLAALRELALLWTADQVEAGLARYRGEHEIRRTWEARERVVVALTGGPEGETLIRRAARVAARSRGGHPQPSHLLAVHVVPPQGISRAPGDDLLRQRRLLAELGGTYHQVVANDVPTGLLEFARGVHATQIVLGSSRRRAWQYMFGPGVGAIVARESGDIDVHIVTHEEVGSGRWPLPPPGRGLGEHRRLAGWSLALLAPTLMSLVLALPPFTDSGPASDAMLLLLITVSTAAVGGLRPALVSALWSAILLTALLSPLHGRPSVSVDNMLALVAFTLVGTLVAIVVEMAARRSAQAARARAEADAVTLLAGSVLSGNEPLHALLRRIRETFGQRSATLLERVDTSPEDGGEDEGEGGPLDGERWRPVHSVGSPAADSPEEADVLVSISDTLALALRGRVLPAADRGVLRAFAAHIGIALEHQRLEWDAAEARRQAAGNRIRTALLAAVSHDLRTPLTSIKASLSSLRATDITLAEEDREALLETVEESTDRLNRLIDNLLDMSRVHTDSVRPKLGPVGLEEVVPITLLGLPHEAITVDVPDGLPRVVADAGLLERAVANVVANAVRHNPDPRTPVLVAASAHGDGVQLRVVDRGPGVSDEGKQRMFEAFQRLGDAPQGTGVGLGLAVARGFVEAMHGTLAPEDTPGGGLTMVFTLKAVRPGGDEDAATGGDDNGTGGMGDESVRGADAGPGR